MKNMDSEFKAAIGLVVVIGLANVAGYIADDVVAWLQQMLFSLAALSLIFMAMKK